MIRQFWEEVFVRGGIMIAGSVWYFGEFLAYIMRKRPHFTKCERFYIISIFIIFCCALFVFGGCRLGAQTETDCSELIPDSYWMTEEQAIEAAICIIKNERIGPVYDWAIRRIIGQASYHFNMLTVQHKCDSIWTEDRTAELIYMFSEWHLKGSKSFREISNGCELRFLVTDIINIDWIGGEQEIDKHPPEDDI